MLLHQIGVRFVETQTAELGAIKLGQQPVQIAKLVFSCTNGQKGQGGAAPFRKLGMTFSAASDEPEIELGVFGEVDTTPLHFIAHLPKFLTRERRIKVIRGNHHHSPMRLGLNRGKSAFFHDLGFAAVRLQFQAAWKVF